MHFNLSRPMSIDLGFGTVRKTMMLAFVAGMALGLAAIAPTDAAASEAEKLAAKKAAILSNLHKKASRALATSAQDPVFKDFFSGNKDAKPQIDKLALSVQSKFHVDEMCLIDENGHEISRIVADQVAPEDDLSTEEASAPFFAPAFAKDVKDVFVSPIYMSPDALKWVVAYVTPVETGGKKVAILHYEHGLEVFQEAANSGLDGKAIVMIVDKDGFIISDSRKAIGVKQNGDSEDRANYFNKMSGGFASAVKLGTDGESSFEAQGKQYMIAYKPVEDWTVVVINPL